MSPRQRHAMSLASLCRPGAFIHVSCSSLVVSSAGGKISTVSWVSPAALRCCVPLHKVGAINVAHHNAQGWEQIPRRATILGRWGTGECALCLHASDGRKSKPEPSCRRVSGAESDPTECHGAASYMPGSMTRRRWFPLAESTPARWWCCPPPWLRASRPRRK
jgi:hypothetical protein